MKSLKMYCLILMLITILVPIHSQIVTGNQFQNKQNLNNDQNSSKTSYYVEIGSMFSSNSNFGNMLSFYTRPEIRYRLSPKLDINTGVILISDNVGAYNVAEKKTGSTYRGYLTVGLNYNPTEKLRITGEILYGMNKSPQSPFANKTSPEYYLRFNAEYKITENLSVGLQVINQNMNQTYYNDPFNNYSVFPNSRYSNPYGF